MSRVPYFTNTITVDSKCTYRSERRVGLVFRPFLETKPEIFKVDVANVEENADELASALRSKVNELYHRHV